MYKLVGDEMFEVVSYSKVKAPTLYGSVWNCYDSPSRAKETAWLQWRDWFNRHSERHGDCIGVASFNSYMFTIGGKISVDGDEYHFKITPSHNYICAD